MATEPTGNQSLSQPNSTELCCYSVAREHASPSPRSGRIDIDSTLRDTFLFDADSPHVDSFVAIDSVENELQRLDQLCGPLDHSNSSESDSSERTLLQRLHDDQRHFFSSGSIISLGAALTLGGVLANTGADEQIYDSFQAMVKSDAGDPLFDFLHAQKELGNGRYTLPIMGAAWLLTEPTEDSPTLSNIHAWGELSSRGFIVGVAPMLAMQHLTGASRPGESPHGATWHLLSDSNGVSGHSFMSALPFIAAAGLSQDRLRKTFWYGCSTLGPLSRVNDGAHYPSQAGLGWFMAYMSIQAVETRDPSPNGWSVRPDAPDGSAGASLRYCW